jgi:hypothetical protein
MFNDLQRLVQQSQQTNLEQSQLLERLRDKPFYLLLPTKLFSKERLSEISYQLKY